MTHIKHRTSLEVRSKERTDPGREIQWYHFFFSHVPVLGLCPGDYASSNWLAYRTLYTKKRPQDSRAGSNEFSSPQNKTEVVYAKVVYEKPVTLFTKSLLSTPFPEDT